MKWDRNKKSDSFEDRRGMSNSGKALIGGGVIGIVALLLSLFGGDTGKNIANILEQVQGNQQTEQTETKTRTLSAEEKELGDFCNAVFTYNVETWAQISKENNIPFRKPGMVLFDDAVTTGCGNATAATGPFYCPADEKIYMDLKFFNELKTRFGAKGGDFAIAYVIGHEFGHHIQNILGTSEKVQQAQQRLSEAQGNKYSVALELQADFYAGVWASHHKDLLEAGDIEEAISAAQAVGDDAIQSKMQGYVQPEKFTHGTSKQRVYWFEKGYNSGDINQGNTFDEIVK